LVRTRAGSPTICKLDGVAIKHFAAALASNFSALERKERGGVGEGARGPESRDADLNRLFADCKNGNKDGHIRGFCEVPEKGYEPGRQLAGGKPESDADRKEERPKTKSSGWGWQWGKKAGPRSLAEGRSKNFDAKERSGTLKGTDRGNPENKAKDIATLKKKKHSS